MKHKDEGGEVLLHHVDLGYTENSTCCELEERALNGSQEAQSMVQKALAHN